MLLSAAIAAILAFYTSKIIAHPINAVTNIAQRVTQEFALALPTAGIAHTDFSSLS
jgi:two-component system, NtrC family, sensor kinase